MIGFTLTLARRLAALALVLVAALPAACAAVAGEQRPVIAVGDLHGDYDAYIAILGDAGLVDARGRWSGGAATFVQLGDVPDRGPDTRKIVEHLMALEKQAKRKGGRVVALIGNHEAMNILGDLRYVTAEEYAAFADAGSSKRRDAHFKANFAELAAFYRSGNPGLDDAGVKTAYERDVPLGYLEHRLAWSPKGKFGAWVCGHDAVVVIGDTLFVHGGISAAYAQQTIDQINGAVRAALANRSSGGILEDEAGPLWHRALAEESAAGEADLAAALAAYGVQRIVIGHTPQVQGIRALYGGRVIAADTGASRAYGGTRSFLRIDAAGVAANDNGAARLLAGPQ